MVYGTVDISIVNGIINQLITGGHHLVPMNHVEFNQYPATVPGPRKEGVAKKGTP